MKRFNLLAGLILAGVACTGQSAWAQVNDGKVAARIIQIADAPAAKDHAPAVMHHDNGGDRSCWGAYLDLMYLKPRGVSVPYGQLFEGDLNPITGEFNIARPFGEVGLVDGDHSPGIRLGVYRTLSNGETQIHARLSWFESTDSSSLLAPALDDVVILPLVVHPSTAFSLIDSLEARADLSIRYWQFDVDLRHPICHTDCFNLNYIIGARYAHLDQDFTAIYDVLGTLAVGSRINFDGFGPRTGLEASYNLSSQCFAYGRTDISLVFGDFRADYLQASVQRGTEATISSSDERLVPILETEIGLGWRSTSGKLEVMAGYSAAAWFNTLTTASWIEGVQSSQFSTSRDNTRDTITFDGLFLRAGVRY